jgi:hypothetical protein
MADKYDSWSKYSLYEYTSDDIRNELKNFGKYISENADEIMDQVEQKRESSLIHYQNKNVPVETIEFIKNKGYTLSNVLETITYIYSDKFQKLDYLNSINLNVNAKNCVEYDYDKCTLKEKNIIFHSQ